MDVLTTFVNTISTGMLRGHQKRSHESLSRTCPGPLRRIRPAVEYRAKSPRLASSGGGAGQSWRGVGNALDESAFRMSDCVTDLLRKPLFFRCLVLRLPLRADPTRQTLADDGR